MNKLHVKKITFLSGAKARHGALPVLVAISGQS